MSDSTDDESFDTVYFDISQFLSEYENRRCLWDKNHVDFRDRRERAKAEESLGEKLGILDIKTLRRKIRSVRGTYNTEMRKVRASLDSGCKLLYKPKLTWFPLADRFLRVTTDIPVDLNIPAGVYNDVVRYIPRKRQKNYVTTMKCQAHPSRHKKEKNWESDTFENDEENIEFLEDNLFENEIIKIDEDGTTYNFKWEKHTTDNEDNSEMSSNSSNMILVERPDPHSSTPRKRVKRNDDKSLADIAKSLNDIHRASENEFAAFGRSVGVQLQNMPMEMALQLQADIQAHITMTRLNYLQSNRETNKDS